MHDEEIPADDLEVTPTGAVEGPPVEAGEEERFLGTPWSRRTFLKAAALGTAAAAVFQKGPGLSFGPAAAYANDLSGSPCTANDVVLVGSGIILNEPCTPCTGTFNALVAFNLHNGTNTGRYCVSLHIPGGFGVPSQDVILHNNADGTGGSTLEPGDHTMYGTVTGFPCGGSVCIGPLDTSGNPIVVRGKCADNTCATLAWSTSPGFAGCTTADQSPPGGQCRHQGICIIGFAATLDCNPATDAIDTNCSVSCGANASLELCVTGGTGPYVFRLYKVNNPGPSETFTLLQTFPTSGSNAGPCHTFSQAVTQTTTFEGRVTDSLGCVRTARTTVTTTPISVSLGVSGETGCTTGNLTFTATPTGCSGSATYTWFLDGTQVQTGSNNTYSYAADPDANNHTVRVEVSCGGCCASRSRTVSQCVTSTVGADTAATCST